MSVLETLGSISKVSLPLFKFSFYYKGLNARLAPGQKKTNTITYAYTKSQPRGLSTLQGRIPKILAVKILARAHLHAPLSLSLPGATE